MENEQDEAAGWQWLSRNAIQDLYVRLDKLIQDNFVDLYEACTKITLYQISHSSLLSYFQARHSQIVGRQYKTLKEILMLMRVSLGARSYIASDDSIFVVDGLYLIWQGARIIEVSR